MTAERERMYENTFYLIDRLGVATDNQDAVDAVLVASMLESIGHLVSELQRTEPRRAVHRSKWQVSADAAA